jgi:hypothetical protein
MQAVRPVLHGDIGEPTRDLNMGEGQEQYITLPTTAIVREGHFVTVSRWRLTDEERKAIAEGADVVHQVVHTPGAYPPMNLQVVGLEDDPQIVR